MKRWCLPLCTLLILSILLSGCVTRVTPVPTTPAPAQPAAVEPTKPPSPTTSPAAAPGAPKRGGTIVWPDVEPNTLNPYIASEAVARSVVFMINRGLVGLDADGQWVPVMAAEIPSADKGTVSADGLTITWKLRPNLKWSDGQPITSDDVKFTWEAISHPESGAILTQGFSLIESVETPDPLTAVVRYKEFYVAWVYQFALGILPRHGTGEAAEMLSWEWNREVNPSNGPYLLEEWQAADHMTFVRNPNYWEEGKPYIDKVIYPITPDFEVQRQVLKAGESDVHHWMVRDYREAFMKLPTITLWESPSPYWYRIQFNLVKRGETRPVTEADPHPILGDVNVRKGIALGINREEITTNWLNPKLLQSMFYGPYKCDLPAYEYNPEKGKQMLDDAGWKDQDGDGVRECRGCKYAKEGNPMRLAITTYSGWGVEDYEAILQQQLKAMGVDAYIQNAEATVLYGSLSEGSPARKGDFDIMYWDYGFGADIDSFAEDAYASWRIPTEKSPAGWNVTRLADPDIDTWITTAVTSPDPAVRTENYCKVAKKIQDEIMNEYVLGVGTSLNATKSTIKGLHPNEQYSNYGMFGYDIENWWIDQ